MKRLAFGVGLFPTDPLPVMVQLLKLSETLGFSHVWVGDSHLIWREAYVNLADGVIILVGVDPVSIRHALERIEAGARAAGRRPDEIDRVLAHPEQKVLDDWLVDKFAIAGTSAEVRAGVERLRDSGIKQVAIIPYGVGGGDREATLRAFASAVMNA